jgi:tRNA(Ile)-lysidine synthase
MPPCRELGPGWHVRPLLDVPQAALLEFAAGRASEAMQDPMNQDPRFDRNYLRHQIWPLIETRWPGSAAALSRTARHAADAQDRLDAGAAVQIGRLRDGDALSLPGLRALSPLERVQVLRHWLCQAGLEPPSSARLTEALRQLLDAADDHLPAIEWGGWALRRYRQRVFVTGARLPRLEVERRWQVAEGARVELGPQLGTLRWAAQPGGLEPARLPQFVMVRRRGGGESIRPAPHAHTQTVQHLCQAQGVLPWMRDALPLVFAGDELVAVADLWQEASRSSHDAAPGLAICWDDAPIIV